MVTTYDPQMPPLEPQVNATREHAIHVKVAWNNLQNENSQVKAALAAHLALPDPQVIYENQIAARQGQVTRVQEALNTVTREACDLLNGLQEHMTTLTLKAQPLMLQLQKINQ